MLEVDYEKRNNVSYFKNHKFIIENKFNIEHEVKSSEIISNIANINLDRAFCWYCGVVLNLYDQSSVSKIFTVIDTDKNQSLDRDEL